MPLRRSRAVTRMLDLAGLPLRFATPAGSDAPSGGNVYNRELTTALGALTNLTVLEFEAAAAAVRAGTPGIYFFDTLDLERSLSLPCPGMDQLFALIVHHLPSLEPDLPSHAPELLVEARALARFQLLLSTSQFTTSLLVGRGLSPSAVLTVPPALPAVAAKSRGYEPPLIALSVASLIPRKNVLALLEALDAHSAVSSEYVLRIVGRTDIDPPYAEACRARVRNSTFLASRVELLGPRPYTRMGELYESSSLLVSAARMETFGMALQEARAHGLPVLAQEGGNVRHHFDAAGGGRLCASETELARELVDLARDAVRMRKFFERAQRSRLAADYGWTQAAERLLTELARVSSARD